MKSTTQKRLTILSLTVLSISSLPLSAEYATAVPLNEFRSEDSSYHFRASDLIGKKILDKNNDNIGEVDDLLVRRSTKGIEAVLSVGGFLGFGDRLVAVPYDTLKISRNGTDLYYDATAETLNALEEFKYENDEQWATAVQSTPEGGLMDQLGVGKNDQGIDWNKLDNYWSEFKDKASSRWTQLTPDDWNTIEGNRTEVISVLSARTGIPKGELELEIGGLVDTF